MLKNTILLLVIIGVNISVTYSQSFNGNYKKLMKMRRDEQRQQLELQREIQSQGIAQQAQADLQEKLAVVDREGEWKLRSKQVESNTQIEKTDRITQQLDRKAKSERAGNWERDIFKSKR